MPVNLAKIEDAFDHLESHIEQWDQSIWIWLDERNNHCKTYMCLMGTVYYLNAPDYGRDPLAYDPRLVLEITGLSEFQLSRISAWAPKRSYNAQALEQYREYVFKGVLAPCGAIDPATKHKCELTYDHADELHSDEAGNRWLVDIYDEF